MTDPPDIARKMADLQKMRMGLVLLTSQESCKLLSRRQRVAGKEIEVMSAERALHEGATDAASREALEALYLEDAVLRRELQETEGEIDRMEQLMARIDADIAALCQA